jgi:CheY-like chemotaxis protein
MVASEILRAVGLEVDCAGDGVRALEMAATGIYDLVLMDMQMPHMDGIAATRAIRERGLALPIVAMTANAFTEDRDACLAAGMNDHTAKPVDPNQLYATLLKWLPAGEPPATPPAPETAAPAATPAFVQRLAEVEGVDAARALANVAGSADLLHRTVKAFVLAYRGGVPAFATQRRGESVARWLEASHSLRGALATVGASPLASELLEFEAELRSSGDVAIDVLQALRLQAQLLALVQRLEQALGDGADD